MIEPARLWELELRIRKEAEIGLLAYGLCCSFMFKPLLHLQLTHLEVDLERVVIRSFFGQQAPAKGER